MTRSLIDAQRVHEQNALQRFALFDREFLQAFSLGRTTIIVLSLCLYALFLAVARPWQIKPDEITLLIASWIGVVVCGLPVALLVVSYVVEVIFKAWDIGLHLVRGELRFKAILLVAPAASAALVALGITLFTLPNGDKYRAACLLVAPILLRFFITGFWSWLQRAKSADSACAPDDSAR